MSGKAGSGGNGGTNATTTIAYKSGGKAYDFASYRGGSAPYAFLGAGSGRMGGSYAGCAGSPKSNYTTSYAPMKIFGQPSSYRRDDEEERRRNYKDFRRAA